MSTNANVREKLIVALDVPAAGAALGLAEKLRGRAGMFKVGSELFTAEGPALVRQLVASGERVFLDLKFHDIPNTVRAASRQASQLGVAIFNVHAAGGRKMMEAAMEGARESATARRAARPLLLGTAPDLAYPSLRPGGEQGVRPLVLAVTLLTSISGAELEELGMAGGAEESVIRLATLAQRAGLDGVVASAREIAAIRQACGPHFVILTPGIRPGAACSDDQARIATPEVAIRAGADYVVVGRPITAATDPAAAAEAVLAEMEAALAPRQAAG